MSSHTLNIREAYLSLGLQEGATLEAVKTSYKAAALRTHPDKNPGNSEATAEFQRVGEAYRVLSKHLTDEPSDDGFDDYGDDEDGFAFVSPLHFAFFMDQMFYQHLFDDFMSGRGGHPRYSRGGGHGPGAHCNCHSHQHRHERQETQQQYKERLERTRKANEEARQRRAEEERLRKERQQRERETEMREAHERQKKKQEDKIAKAEVQRKKAEEAKRAQNQKSQKLRSQVFRAARDGNSAKAKELIWEHSIDATGGEVKAGCEEYVQCKPKDLSETLLHIAVKQDNLDLVEWLTTHGADLEERNSQGLTGLHLALKLGRISIVKHIVEAYPPGDSRGIYETPKGVTLLSLAIESKEPELVWVVLENKLASPQDISKAWQKATSVSSQPKAESTKRSDIIELLKTYGGLTPPATPHKTKDSSKPFNDTKHEHDGVQARGQAANSNSQPASKRNANTDLPPGPTPSVAQPQAPKANQQQQKPQGSRGRGNGRGRGRGRGRGNSGKA